MFGWRRLMKQRVVVNLKSGRAFQGIIMRRSGPFIFMLQAVMHEPDLSDGIPVDGEVAIPVSDIEFIQNGGG